MRSDHQLRGPFPDVLAAVTGREQHTAQRSPLLQKPINLLGRYAFTLLEGIAAGQWGWYVT